MKRSYIIILLLSLCSFTWAQSSRFEKLSDMEGVASVTISKTMLRMMQNVGGKNNPLNDISSKIEGLMMLSCSEDEAIPKFKQEITFLNEKNGYEKLMNVKEEGQNTTIFMKKMKQGSMEYVVRVESAESMELIVIAGKLTLDEAKNFSTQFK